MLAEWSKVTRVTHAVPAFMCGVDARRVLRADYRVDWGALSTWLHPGCQADGGVLDGGMVSKVQFTDKPDHTGRPRFTIIFSKQ